MGLGLLAAEEASVRIGIIGTGGVGGYFGARLAAAGENVTFLARGKNLEALRQHGLTLHSGDEAPVKLSVHAFALDEFVANGPYDVVLWCVKSYQNEEAARGLDPLALPESWWLPLQNGVETEDFLHARFPKAQILGGTCYVSALLESPGVVRHYASGIITFGDIGFSDPVRTKTIVGELHKTFQESRIVSIQSADISADKWKKLVWNASLNTLSAISGSSPLELLSQDSTRELVRKAMYEVVDVAQALGINLTYKDSDRHIEITRKLPDVRTSMAWDVMNGSAIEHEALCGVVVRLGEREGVATPVLRIFYTLLSLYEQRRKGGATPPKG